MHWDILDRASQLGTLLGAPGVMGLLASTVQCCPGGGWFADAAEPQRASKQCEHARYLSSFC